MLKNKPAASRKPMFSDYQEIFAAEQNIDYQAIGKLERRYGYAVDRKELENAARVLACPLKVNPPNWQHGRLLYSIGRAYLNLSKGQDQLWFDIGTAKGFSACVMSWCLRDAPAPGKIVSIDMLEPDQKVPRNSVVEVLQGYQTVDEFTRPFLAPGVITEFHGGGSQKFFRTFGTKQRINFAFIDGKHNYAAVKEDAMNISARQKTGDVIVFDDVHLTAVREAAQDLEGYTLEMVQLKRDRAYAIRTKK